MRNAYISYELYSKPSRTLVGYGFISFPEEASPHVSKNLYHKYMIGAIEGRLQQELRFKARFPNVRLVSVISHEEYVKIQNNKIRGIQRISDIDLFEEE